MGRIMENYGCYIIKDDFFNTYDDPYLKGNKKGNRPHYCCFKDKDNEGLFWVIPMSHQIDKYEKLIDKRLKQNKPCDIVHIIKINNAKSVLLIQDMFPIIEKYIERPYTINSIPLVIKNSKDINEINKKAKNIFRLINRKTAFNPTQPDVLRIKEQLIEEIKEDSLLKI